LIRPGVRYVQRAQQRAQPGLDFVILRLDEDAERVLRKAHHVRNEGRDEPGEDMLKPRRRDHGLVALLIRAALYFGGQRKIAALVARLGAFQAKHTFGQVRLRRDRHAVEYRDTAPRPGLPG
jgi:hypothetical protein